MTKDFSRRVFLSGLFAATGSPLWAKGIERSLRPVARGSKPALQQAKPLKTRVNSADALITEAKLSGAVGFAVADAKSGLMLEGHSPRVGQPPASVTKAVTALYALSELGAGHRFYTRLIASGPVSGGVLQGDLILQGGGDPTLSTDALANLARALKSKGINAVQGRFLVDRGEMPYFPRIDADQPDHVGYNPAISGLNLNYNRVHFEWKKSGGQWRTTMDARSDKYRPEVRIARMKISKRALPVYTYADRDGVDYWTVASGALGKGGSRWLPVRKPELYAGDVFRTFARSHGIKLSAAKLVKTKQGGSVIAQHTSADLRIILRDMLKYSNNLTAEVVGVAATTKRRGKVSSLKASAGEMSKFAKAGLGMGSAKFVDHSGLGDASRMSAQDMVKGLVRVHKTRGLRPILKPIAMRDSKGRVLKGHPIKVHAKTGTLNFVSALAGYMTAADGTELAFAIFAADQKKRAVIKRADREKPQGARGWNRRAKRLQQRLIERWGALYGT